MTNQITLSELALEIRSVGSILTVLSMIVMPNREAINGGCTPTEQTIDQVFYSAESTLSRIAAELQEMES